MAQQATAPSSNGTADEALKQLFRDNQATLDPLMEAIFTTRDDHARKTAIAKFGIMCGKLARAHAHNEIVAAIRGAVNGVMNPPGGQA